MSITDLTSIIDKLPDPFKPVAYILFLVAIGYFGVKAYLKALKAAMEAPAAAAAQVSKDVVVSGASLLDLKPFKDILEKIEARLGQLARIMNEGVEAGSKADEKLCEEIRELTDVMKDIHKQMELNAAIDEGMRRADRHR